jgi:hypothetical protein
MKARRGTPLWSSIRPSNRSKNDPLSLNPAARQLGPAVAVHFVIGTQKFIRIFRRRFICLQSARGLAQSKTLRVFRKSSYCAQRLGVRWPSTAFPGGKPNCTNVDRNRHRFPDDF